MTAYAVRFASTMNTTNSTSPASCIFPLSYRITVSSLLAIIALFSPILNFTVCYTIFCVKRLHTFDYILIANLSISDVMVSLLLPSLEIVYVSVHPKWLIGKAGTYVLNSVWLFSLAAPFVTVTAISFERYKTIKSLIPVTSKPIIASALALIWLYNCGAVAIMAFNFTVPGSVAYEWNVLPEFYYPFLGVHILIPLILIAILNVCIFRMASASGRGTVKSRATHIQMTKRESRIAKTIAIVVGVMFIIWIPALVLEYFYAIGTHSCIVQMAGPISVWLSCSNGIVNPIIYFYRNPVLRKEMTKIFNPKGKVSHERARQHHYVSKETSAKVNKACQTSDDVKHEPATILSNLSTLPERFRTYSETSFDTQL